MDAIPAHAGVYYLQDDKESLERLHDLIHGGDGDEPPLEPFTREEDSPPATPKAERRRSLPSRTSMTSLSSEFSVCTIVSPEPEEAEFQTRRRRAAKLTQFFGVNYRDLMSEILESIEKGLEEEGGLGTLKPDEVQVCDASGSSIHLKSFLRFTFIGTSDKIAQAEIEADWLSPLP